MKIKNLTGIAVLLLFAGCSNQPECSYSGSSAGAPSAGCLVVDQGDLLLVKIMGGFYGPPGGSVDSDEAAQCAAERETWEETGITVRAGELAMEFENGFQLYWCESVSGREINITRPIEIQDADWFAPDEFVQLRWRYANQGDTIYSLMGGGNR